MQNLRDGVPLATSIDIWQQGNEKIEINKVNPSNPLSSSDKCYWVDWTNETYYGYICAKPDGTIYVSSSCLDGHGTGWHETYESAKLLKEQFLANKDKIVADYISRRSANTFPHIDAN